jgi:hypothetical protein
MIFIHPMWGSESQRLGLKACTPFGYFLREVADGIGLVGLLLLFVVPLFLIYQVIVKHFSWPLCWALLIPFAIGVIGRVLFAVKNNLSMMPKQQLLSGLRKAKSKYFQSESESGQFSAP